jgi:hypothetical protein
MREEGVVELETESIRALHVGGGGGCFVDKPKPSGRAEATLSRSFITGKLVFSAEPRQSSADFAKYAMLHLLHLEVRPTLAAAVSAQSERLSEICYGKTSGVYR